MSNLINLYNQVKEIGALEQLLSATAKEFGKTKLVVDFLLINGLLPEEQQARSIQIAQNILISNNQKTKNDE